MPNILCVVLASSQLNVANQFPSRSFVWSQIEDHTTILFSDGIPFDSEHEAGMDRLIGYWNCFEICYLIENNVWFVACLLYMYWVGCSYFHVILIINYGFHMIIKPSPLIKSEILASCLPQFPDSNNCVVVRCSHSLHKLLGLNSASNPLQLLNTTIHTCCTLLTNNVWAELVNNQ